MRFWVPKKNLEKPEFFLGFDKNANLNNNKINITLKLLCSSQESAQLY